VPWRPFWRAFVLLQPPLVCWARHLVSGPVHLSLNPRRRRTPPISRTPKPRRRPSRGAASSIGDGVDWGEALAGRGFNWVHETGAAPKRSPAPQIPRWSSATGIPRAGPTPLLLLSTPSFLWCLLSTTARAHCHTQPKMFQRASFCRGLVVASVTMTYGDSPWSQMNERIWAVKKKSSLSFFLKNLNFLPLGS
jgi:hypothetical protein